MKTQAQEIDLQASRFDEEMSFGAFFAPTIKSLKNQIIFVAEEFGQVKPGCPIMGDPEYGIDKETIIGHGSAPFTKSRSRSSPPLSSEIS